MAIIKVSNELDNENWFKELMNRTFDNIERLTDEPYVKVYRVQNDEVPKDDKQICFDAISLNGVKPFVIEFY
jgi:hypothetical protein